MIHSFLRIQVTYTKHHAGQITAWYVIHGLEKMIVGCAPEKVFLSTPKPLFIIPPQNIANKK